MKVTQSRPTLCDPMDYTFHRILQARIMEWVAFPFSRGSSQPRDQIQVSHIAGWFFTSWATREAQEYWSVNFNGVDFQNNFFLICSMHIKGFPCGSAGKETACNAGDLGSISGLGRSPGEGKGYPCQYSGLENSMDYTVAKSRTRLTSLTNEGRRRHQFQAWGWGDMRHGFWKDANG